MTINWDIVTPIVAVYGVLQVWLIGLWRRFFRQPAVEIHSTLAIEVGYSNFGPTLGIYGALLVLHRPVLVESVSLSLRRERDRAQHRFDWFIFRSNQITIGVPQAITAELAGPIMLDPAQPYRYNMLLSDREQLQQMRPVLQQITNTWTELGRAALARNAVPNFGQTFEEFVRGGQALPLWSPLERFCYWDAGDYTCIITVRTNRPTRIFSVPRRFTLTQEDSDRLRGNAFNILAELCARPNIVYNFAYPSLQPQ